MLRHSLPLRWFLSLLLSLTLTKIWTHKYPAFSSSNYRPTETPISQRMAHSNTDSNPYRYFSPDFMNELVDECRLFLIAHHLSVKQFKEQVINSGLIGYFGEAPVFKEEEMEPTLDLLRHEDVFFQAYNLRLVWCSIGIEKWFGNQIAEGFALRLIRIWFHPSYAVKVSDAMTSKSHKGKEPKLEVWCIEERRQEININT